MSQQREMIVTADDTVPQGPGWKLAHTSGDYRLSELYFIWVREPVPDAWQDFSGPSGCMMFDDCGDPLPAGFEPMGPWKQYAMTAGENGLSVGWRRPLRRIESETLELPPNCCEESSRFGTLTVEDNTGEWPTTVTVSAAGVEIDKGPALPDVLAYALARYAQLNGGAA